MSERGLRIPPGSGFGVPGVAQCLGQGAPWQAPRLPPPPPQEQAAQAGGGGALPTTCDAGVGFAFLSLESQVLTSTMLSLQGAESSDDDSDEGVLNSAEDVGGKRGGRKKGARAGEGRAEEGAWAVADGWEQKQDGDWRQWVVGDDEGGGGDASVWVAENRPAAPDEGPTGAKAGKGWAGGWEERRGGQWQQWSAADKERGSVAEGPAAGDRPPAEADREASTGDVVGGQQAEDEDQWVGGDSGEAGQREEGAPDGQWGPQGKRRGGGEGRGGGEDKGGAQGKGAHGGAETERRDLPPPPRDADEWQEMLETHGPDITRETMIANMDDEFFKDIWPDPVPGAPKNELQVLRKGGPEALELWENQGPELWEKLFCQYLEQGERPFGDEEDAWDRFGGAPDDVDGEVYVSAKPENSDAPWKHYVACRSALRAKREEEMKETPRGAVCAANKTWGMGLLPPFHYISCGSP